MGFVIIVAASSLGSLRFSGEFLVALPWGAMYLLSSLLFSLESLNSYAM